MELCLSLSLWPAMLFGVPKSYRRLVVLSSEPVLLDCFARL
jgi:hypothetical protein